MKSSSAHYWQVSEACEPYPGNIYFGCLSQEQYIMLNQKQYKINELPPSFQELTKVSCQSEPSGTGCKGVPPFLLRGGWLKCTTHIQSVNIYFSILSFYLYTPYTPPYRSTKLLHPCYWFGPVWPQQSTMGILHSSSHHISWITCLFIILSSFYNSHSSWKLLISTGFC